MVDSLRWIRGTWFTLDDVKNYSWHDVAVHGVGFFPDDGQVRFDVDCVVEWPSDLQNEFSVVPATLTFYDVQDFSFSLSAQGVEIWLKELILESTVSADAKRWVLTALQGRFVVTAGEYDLFLRADPYPLKQGDQRLSSSARGGVSFERALTPPS